MVVTGETPFYNCSHSIAAPETEGCIDVRCLTESPPVTTRPVRTKVPDGAFRSLSKQKAIDAIRSTETEGPVTVGYGFRHANRKPHRQDNRLAGQRSR